MPTKSKKTGGRPPKYAEEQVFRDACVAYFKQCIDGRAMPNKAGLCLALKISRDTYNEYRKRFPDALKAAEDYVEDAWVQRLAGNAPTGAIFYLKNAFAADYKDRQTLSGDSENPLVAKVVIMPPRNAAGGLVETP